MKPIVGKIAGIVTDNTVAINRGTSDGVAVGMQFIVQLDVPKIEDPENPERVLAGVFYEKARLTITQIYDNFSFASLVPKGQRYSNMLGQIVTTLYPATDPPMLSERDWRVKVGDIVRQVIKPIEKKDNESSQSSDNPK